MSDTKTCPECGNIYPATDEYFYRRFRDKYWLGSYCKPCHRAHVLRNWRANPDREKLRKRRRFEKRLEVR